MKDPTSKKRSLADVEDLVAEVVARDRLPEATETTFAHYDKAHSELPFRREEFSSSPAADIADEIMPPPIEELTGFDSCSIEAREETIRVDRKEHFPKMKGFHSSYHVSTKYNLKLVVEKIDYRVETLEHIHSGKRRTADLSSLGPDQQVLRHKCR